MRVVLGRIRPRRVKRTSLGVWRREDVTANMFSGERKGRVQIKAMEAVMKRMLRARKTGTGVARIGTGEVFVMARWVR